MVAGVDESEEMSACDGATAAENRWHLFCCGVSSISAYSTWNLFLNTSHTDVKNTTFLCSLCASEFSTPQICILFASESFQSFKKATLPTEGSRFSNRVSGQIPINGIAFSTSRS